MTIFLCHSSTDKALVREIRGHLPQFLHMWLDEEKLAWGESFSEILRSTISCKSDFVIAFLSKEALNHDCVLKEIAWAKDQEKDLGSPFLLVTLIKPATPNRLPPELAGKLFKTLENQEASTVKAFAQHIADELFKLTLKRLAASQPPQSPSTRPASAVGSLATPPIALSSASDNSDAAIDTIVILREGDSITKRRAISEACPKLKLLPLVVDEYRDRKPEIAVIDACPGDLTKIVHELEGLGRRKETRHRILGVATFEELEVLNAARIAKYLGLPYHNTVDAVTVARNKHMMRDVLSKADIRNVRYCLAADFTHARDGIRARQLTYPLIVKPLNGATAIGVEKACNEPELEKAIERCKETIRRVRQRKATNWRDVDSSQVLIEEYIQEGPAIPPREISVEAVVYEGDLTVYAMHEKLEMRHEPPFLESIFVSPPSAERYTDSEIGEIRDIVRKAVDAMGLRFGPIHAELRMGPEGPLLLEIGARPGGGIVVDSVRERTNLDLHQIALSIATGRYTPIVEIPDSRLSTCIAIVYPETRGLLQKIVGVNKDLLSTRNDVFSYYTPPKTPRRIHQEESTWLLNIGITCEGGDAYGRFRELRSNVRYWVSGKEYHGRDLSAHKFDREG